MAHGLKTALEKHNACAYFSEDHSLDFPSALSEDEILAPAELNRNFATDLNGAKMSLLLFVRPITSRQYFNIWLQLNTQSSSLPQSLKTTRDIGYLHKK